MTPAERFVELEGKADAGERKTSSQRWEAAQIVWDQHNIRRKSFPQLSREIKAAGGKGSLGHLFRMNKCWDIIVAQNGREVQDYGDLPSFYQTYNSDEVRGESDEDDPSDREPGERGGSDREPRSRSGHDYVEKAVGAIAGLQGLPALWPGLEDGDIEALRKLPARIQRLVRDIERS